MPAFRHQGSFSRLYGQKNIFNESISNAMKYVNFHTHSSPEDQINITAIISCVAPEPLQECPNGVLLSYGIHPWYIHGHDLDQLMIKVEKAAGNSHVVAIGEAGLDKLKGPALGLQKKIFCRQIDISESSKKPLIIHSVKANNEVLKLKKEMSPSQAWILHGFNGHPQEMEQFVNAGFYLSFGPRILYPDHNAAESLQQIPSDKFFLETDHTNKSIKALYERAAEIRHVTVCALEQTIWGNFETLMGKLGSCHV